MSARFALRSYQQQLVQEACLTNKIVVLPTGAGKTLVAAEVVKQRGGTALFLVPTCLLVEQQANAIRDWLGPDKIVAEFMGSVQVPDQFDVLVSTPKAFHVRQCTSAPGFAWNSFDTVVFDEVHHVLKEHPYRKLALSLLKSGAAPRVIGLTASLTYAVTEERMKASVQRICEELRITSPVLIVPQDELKAAGYHGTAAKAEMRLMPIPSELIKGLVPESERKPHLLLPTFFARIKAGTATPLATNLMDCIYVMERHVKELLSDFKSPLSNSGSDSWGKYAHAEGLRRGSPQLAELEHWYEALKIIATTWEEAQDHPVPLLQIFEASTGTDDKVAWPANVNEKLGSFWSTVPDSTPRFDCLAEVLMDEYHREGRTSAFRGIIFVERRVSSHVLAQQIILEPELAKLFTPGCLYAANSPVTPSLGLTKKEVQRVIQDFRQGNINLLIATAAAEEGMDIPEANCVICFDHITHGVALVQRRGRAREAGSSFIIMSERPDRPVSFLSGGEQEQQGFLQGFTPVASGTSGEKERIAQRSRELTASTLLQKKVDTSTVIGTLNAYGQKTKTALQETFISVAGSNVKCLLKYESSLRCFEVEESANGLARSVQSSWQQ